MSWTKRQRLEAIINGEPADRPPIVAYRHFPGREHRAEDLAAAMVEFQRQYDWDFMKINPRAVYYHQVWGNEYDFSRYNDVMPFCTHQAINSVDDLGQIEERPGDYGTLGEQLNAVRMIRRELGEEVPLMQTIFTPIGVLLNLCGARSLGRYREAPREQSPIVKLFLADRDGVHRALKAIANTLAQYAAATIQAGADGVFYAALGMAREGYLTLAEWEEYVRPYDLIVLEALKSVPTILHTCGIRGNPQRFLDYPVSILHWAESAPGNPSIADSVHWIGNKAVMGGVDERLFGTGAAQEIALQAAKAIEQHRGRPFVLAPECSVSVKTLDEEFRAFRAVATG
jgi:Uroporphyrinogen-III decarboxylase